MPGTYRLTFDGQERQLVLMALGELLSSVSREEHLTLAIQELIAKVKSTPAGEDRGSLTQAPEDRPAAKD